MFFNLNLKYITQKKFVFEFSNKFHVIFVTVSSLNVFSYYSRNILIFHGHQTSNVTRPQQRHCIQIKYCYTISNNKFHQAVDVALLLNTIKSRYYQCDNKRATTVKGDVQ